MDVPGTGHDTSPESCSQPTLETARLTLRPFYAGDASAVQRLAGDRSIAETTANIPHPYPEGEAEAWIATHPDRFARGESVIFAITRRDDGLFLGSVGLEIDREMLRAELGYWVGKPYWNQGYCSEAARAVVHYAFETLGLRRVFARHYGSNAASGRVMQKVGLRYEGTLRQHTIKWDAVHDLVVYGALRTEWHAPG
jgi:RimJ/RimL family protein N-acetyltransferase